MWLFYVQNVSRIFKCKYKYNDFSMVCVIPYVDSIERDER